MSGFKVAKLAIPLCAALLCGTAPALAVPILGPNLASFAVLGATGVTNVPTSTIGGNLGSSPDPSVGGGYVFTFGELQPNTTIAQDAQVELDAAIDALNAFGPGTLIAGGDLDAFQTLQGGSIAPGTYTVEAATTNLVGDLILDGGGSNDAVWVFQMPSTLITSTGSNVTVQNVGDGADVGLYWNVGSGATLNGPTFAGNVLAQTLISSDGDLTLACGRLLSATASVTLIQDTISIGCEGTGFEASGGFDQGVDTGFDIGNGDGDGNGDGNGNGTVPEPATFLLIGLGLAGLVAFAGRRRAA